MLKFIGWLSMTMLYISSWALVAHGVLRWVSAENDHVDLSYVVARTLHDNYMDSCNIIFA